MSNLCGVWYRAGACILPFRHDGLHLTQEQDGCNRVRAQVDELTAANTALSERLAAVTAALDLAHQALLAYRFPAGSTPDELDREADRAIKVATRAILAASASASGG